MMKNLKVWSAIVIITATIVLSFAAGIRLTGIVNAEDNKYEELKVFTEVLAVVKRNYVEEVNTKDLVYDALKGMLRSLDPHSGFLTPEDFKEMKVDTKGEFGGLGIQISIKDNLLTVIAPIEDTPAWKAGIQAGDRIIKIEEESTKDMTLHEAVSKMRGKKGTPIKITVIREGMEKPKEYTIVRDIIKIKSVKSRMIEGDIAYIKLSQFQERSAEDLETALRELMKDGKVKSIILDLRNNPGGLLSSAIDVSSLFLPKDKLVVYTMDRSGNKNEYASNGKTVSSAAPMVILVNQGSASAAEIVSGALKDWNRAVILGITTFGKGSVQSVIPLSDGAGVRITTAKYYTPKGISIQNTGIKPDIEVKLEAKNGAKAHTVIRESDLEGSLKNEQIDGKDKKDSKDSEEAVVSLADLDEKDDTQLQRAIELLKTWVVFKNLPTDAAIQNSNN